MKKQKPMGLHLRIKGNRSQLKEEAGKDQIIDSRNPNNYQPIKEFVRVKAYDSV